MLKLLLQIILPKPLHFNASTLIKHLQHICAPLVMQKPFLFPSCRRTEEEDRNAKRLHKERTSLGLVPSQIHTQKATGKV